LDHFMRKIIISILLLLLMKPLLFAKTDIRIDHEYDPRITLRVVVLPAIKDRSLRSVNERSVSALLATELLSIYEVVDLVRFETFLTDRKFSLENAFSIVAEKVVRDSAQVDAIATIEVYRWDEGTGGLPLLGKKDGSIGVRIRMMDPFTGRLYWSLNRLDKVNPGTEFMNRTTELFRKVVKDIDKQLMLVTRELNEFEEAEVLLAHGEAPRLQGYGSRKFTTSLRRERGFVPRGLPQVTSQSDQQPQMIAENIQPEEENTKPPILPFELLPPLFDDENLEDIENPEETPSSTNQPQLDPQQGPTNVTNTGENATAGPPPIPERFQGLSSELPDVNSIQTDWDNPEPEDELEYEE